MRFGAVTSHCTGDTDRYALQCLPKRVSWWRSVSHPPRLQFPVPDLGSGPIVTGLGIHPPTGAGDRERIHGSPLGSSSDGTVAPFPMDS